MKKIIAFVFALAIVLSSCSLPLTNYITGKGSIVVNLPGKSKSLITSAVGQANVSSYYVYIFDPSKSTYTSLTNVPATSSSATINVAAGSYSVLVVAANGYMLGAGETKSVTVTAGATTSTTVTINPIDLQFSVTTPPALGLGSSMTVNVSGCWGIDAIKSGYFNFQIYDSDSSSVSDTVNAYYLLAGSTTSEFSQAMSLSLNKTVTATTNQIAITAYGATMAEGSCSFGLSVSPIIGYSACPSSVKSSLIKTFTPSTTTGMSVGIAWGADY